jgi:single-strand DNA-binding protein
MASRSLNKVMLIGNLGKDAETRFTPSGTAVTNFTVATSRRWKDQQSGEWKEETDWHDVVLWRSENVSQYLLKGKQVFVEGRLQTRSWEDQNGNKRYRTEVVADNLILLRGGGAEGGGGGGSSDEYSQQGSSRQQAAGAGARNAGGAEAEDHGITDDDVPF